MHWRYHSVALSNQFVSFHIPLLHQFQDDDLSVDYGIPVITDVLSLAIRDILSTAEIMPEDPWVI